ncbi:MAG TPA: HPr family phosphocarrier protein [Clostridia bacterium]|nr:HPr family phosphocarrier protein [Clostridia bacterium]
MIESTIKILHESGLGARPAALFVQVASRFNSRIWVGIGSKKINAKSIMGILSLGIALNDEIIIMIKGDDEKDAMDALIKLVKGNFTHIPDIVNKED